MGLYQDQGVVVRTIRLGEADRIVTLVTAGRGKVRAVAKGVRKTKSRFGGRLEPLTHVALLLYEGRELDIITQADALENFRPIREDLDRLAKATSVLEAADQLSQERQANSRLYGMLLGALRALAAHDAPMLVPAFLLKALSLEGFHPVLHECVSCGATDGLGGFDIDEGGVVCMTCAGGGGGGPEYPALSGRSGPVSPGALDLLRRVLGGDLRTALQELSGPATVEVSRLATRTFEHHLERRLRSVGTLEHR